MGLLTAIKNMFSKPQNPPPTNVNKTTTTENKYNQMRELSFSLTPEKLRLGPSDMVDGVYGIIVETDFGGVAATSLGLIGGEASIYVESGMMLIGGHKIPGIPEMVKHWIRQASKLQKQMIEPTEIRLPENAHSKIYLLTEKGLLESPAINMNSPDHGPYGEIVLISQELLSAFRKNSGN